MSKYRDLLLYNLQVILEDRYNHSLLSQFSNDQLEFILRENMKEIKSVSELMDINPL